jgi:hypothetical protein
MIDIRNMTVRGPISCWALAFAPLVAAPAAAGEPLVNLALVEHGGIPSALDAAPTLSNSAQKAADGRADTAWVSGTAQGPTWLECAWRRPVEVRRLVLIPPPASLSGAASPPGPFLVRARHGEQWERIASGDARQATPGSSLQVDLETPCRTTALRLYLKPAGRLPVGIGEWQILGPRPVRPAEFAPAWQALYIWCPPSLLLPNRQPVRRYLRRRFTVDAPQEVKQVWLVACAFDRLDRMWLNNQQVLSDISYHGGLMREAQVREVPPVTLQRGENVLAAEVDDLYEVGSQGLLAELVLAGRDGKRTIIPTDAQWKGEEDQGAAGQWRRPGFSDDSWAACRPVAGPNSAWHTLYTVPYPLIAPPETFEVVELGVPSPVAPGSEAACRVTLETRTVPRADYAVAVRLGQRSRFVNHDYDLGGTVLRPEEVNSAGWGPGRHTVTLRLFVPDGAPRAMPATLMVSLPQSGVGLTTRLPGCRTDAYGLHFTIPVERKVREPAAQSGFAANEIRMVGGTPTLSIDGRPTSAVLWSSAYGNYHRYSAYAATGVKLFRPVLDGSPICAPGEEDRYFPWWLAEVDRMIEAALDVDPEIRVLPALFMDPHPEVLFADPSEQMTSGRAKIVIPIDVSCPDRGQVRPTFMSHEWRRRGGEGLKRLVEHMRSRPYAPRVVGICLFAGRGGENYYGLNELNLLVNERGEYDAVPRSRWDAGDFSPAARLTFREFLLAKYPTDAALAAGWQRPGVRRDDVLDPALFRREETCDLLVGPNREAPSSLRDPLEPQAGTLPMDYYQCFAEAMLDTFDAWGRAVKEASGRRLIVGCYYGYALAQLFTAVPGFAGHTAADRAARAGNLDFFCSPSEYDQHRRSGGHYWAHDIIDSLRLHNKLFIFEQDTRTFLADAEPKTYSRRETLEVMKREAAAALVRGAGWWWYEFATGQAGATSREWFDDPALAALARRVKRVADFTLSLPRRGPAAQIAVFYHGDTCTAQDIFPPTLPLNVSIGRLTLLEGMERIGAPFDLYNLADLPELARRGWLDRYCLCLMLNPFYLSSEQRGWIELAKGGGRTLVWLWAPGLARVGRHLRAENVAEVVGLSGVRLLWELREPTCRLAFGGHPLGQGLPEGLELAPRPFPPGDTWARFGNRIAPIPYVAPDQADPETRILGHWVESGRVRPDRGAFCVRDLRGGGDRGWASVYSAVPYLTPALLRNIARFAGVHIYRSVPDVLFVNPHFVAIHTGARAAGDVLLLPGKSPVYDVFAGKRLAADADRLTLDVPPYSTALYYLGDPAPLEAALEANPAAPP